MMDLILLLVSFALNLGLFLIYKPIYLKLKCTGTLELDENGELNLRINKDMAGEKYIIIEQKIVSRKKHIL